MSNTTLRSTHELAIIGGGPAGMSAALVAGRAQLSTVVINDENPRNAVTTASHGFLTRDGAHPLEILAVAKEQLAKYEAARYVVATVADVRKLDDGFEVELANGTLFTSRRVIIATGFKDDLTRLKLPGIEDVYGRSVYPCPFCDGFEHKNEALAVFGGPGVEHFVPVVRMWSNNLVVFTNGAQLPTDASLTLKRKGVRVIEEPVVRLISEDGTLNAVEIATGEHVRREAGFIADDFSFPSSDYAVSLGVKQVRNDWGMQVAGADNSGKTDIEGVYIIGDSKNGFTGVIGSASEGAACAESIVHEIAGQRWETAG